MSYGAAARARRLVFTFLLLFSHRKSWKRNTADTKEGEEEEEGPGKKIGFDAVQDPFPFPQVLPRKG